jgi:hypothetical protein
MIYLKRFESFNEEISSIIDDILLPLIDINLASSHQIQSNNRLVIYITPNYRKNYIYFYLSSIRYKINHLISQLEECGYQLNLSRFRPVGGHWFRLYDTSVNN